MRTDDFDLDDATERLREQLLDNAEVLPDAPSYRAGVEDALDGLREIVDATPPAGS